MIELVKIGVAGEHYAFWTGGVHIGNAEKIGDYWLVQNKRKPVASTKEASKQMIDAKMSQLQNEKDLYHKLLQRIMTKKEVGK